MSAPPVYVNGCTKRCKRGSFKNHACLLGDGTGLALCGVRIASKGWNRIPDETDVGCKRCRRILIKRAIIKE